MCYIEIVNMDTSRILVVGDIHAPFEHKDYLDHCKGVAKFYKTTHTVIIGDEIDNHYSSFHETNPDGYGAGEELDKAMEALADYHKAFPHADVILGNHNRIIERKLSAGGLSKRWMRGYSDVLGVPTWRYETSRLYDGVMYIHGEGVTARTRALREGRSVVQGHRHTEGYVWYNPMPTKQIFGMQVGTGIDSSAYAFAYAKDHPLPVLSCGVVVGGKRAYLEPML